MKKFLILLSAFLLPLFLSFTFYTLGYTSGKSEGAYIGANVVKDICDENNWQLRTCNSFYDLLEDKENGNN